MFGSQIYQTNTDKSDIDILIIAKTSYTEKEIIVDNLNIHILTLDKFLDDLKQFNIGRIECILSPIKLKEDIVIPFEMKLNGLRHMSSHIASNSFVKAKKKIEQGDYYIGIKSLFHSLRIIMFSIQLVENNNIINWQCANYIWEELKSKEWTWEELKEKYQPLKNKLMTEFRKITNK